MAVELGALTATFTSGEYILTLAREPSGRWRLVSDSLLTISDGHYSFAPLENLPPDIRALEERGRQGPPPPAQPDRR